MYLSCNLSVCVCVSVCDVGYTGIYGYLFTNICERYRTPEKKQSMKFWGDLRLILCIRNINGQQRWHSRRRLLQWSSLTLANAMQKMKTKLFNGYLRCTWCISECLRREICNLFKDHSRLKYVTTLPCEISVFKKTHQPKARQRTRWRECDGGRWALYSCSSAVWTYIWMWTWLLLSLDTEVCNVLFHDFYMHIVFVCCIVLNVVGLYIFYRCISFSLSGYRSY